MARKKMTEEEKETRKAAKEQAYNLVAAGLKYLTFSELDEVIGLAMKHKKERLGKEELRLIKEKEKIEQQIAKLKELDLSYNG
jgi:hypothetical protein